MENTDIFTKIIPAIMVFCIVYYNVRKMQKRAQAMRQEHTCCGGCAGCAHSAGCNKPEKTSAQDNSPEE